jgi:hypothetical protein
VLASTVASADDAINARISAFPDGALEIEATNNSRSSITALIAVGKRHFTQPERKIQSVRVFDSVLNPFGTPALLFGQKHVFRMFGPIQETAASNTREAELKAAIFSDGSTWGDERWINILLLRRRVAYKCESDALQVLTDAKLHSWGPDTILAKLTTTQGRHMAEARSVAEKQMTDAIFTETNMLVQHSIKKMQLAGMEAAIGSHMNSSKYTESAVERLLMRLRGLEDSKPDAAKYSTPGMSSPNIKNYRRNHEIRDS